MTPETLAEMFAWCLRGAVNQRQFDYIRQRNALPEYVDCCASHDFTDANIAMLRAFEKCAGRIMVMDESEQAQADRRMWNAAWDIAKRDYLTEKK